MMKRLLCAVALGAALALPLTAEAAEGYATANVNMRSGPSTAYPAVTVIPAGAPLNINGCLAETPWCDVAFAGGRGWVAGRYVQAVYQDRRVYVGPEYYEPLGIPTIGFNLDNYWGRYYRGRDFYQERDRWRYDTYRRGDYGYGDNRPNRDWRRNDRNQYWDSQPGRRPDRGRDWGGQPQRGPDRQQVDRNPGGPRPDNGGNRPNPNRGGDVGPYSPLRVTPGGCTNVVSDCGPSERGSNR